MTYTRVDYLGVIDVAGEESAAFLQSQLSADIEALAPGDCTFACYCTPRGQVIALLLVCRVQAGFKLICHVSLAQAVLDRLRMYVMRAKTSFSLEDSIQILGAAESHAGLDSYPASDSGLFYNLGEKSEEGLEAGSLADWKATELAQGIFWLDEATSEQFIPQMLGYEELGALSFKKGCYPGQEIVARAHYLGKVKRGIRSILLEKPVEIQAMAKVRIERNSEWSQARAMDSVIASNGSTRLIVQCTAEPSDEVTAIELEGQRYGCATM